MAPRKRTTEPAKPKEAAASEAIVEAAGKAAPKAKKAAKAPAKAAPKAMDKAPSKGEEAPKKAAKKPVKTEPEVPVKAKPKAAPKVGRKESKPVEAKAAVVVEDVSAQEAFTEQARILMEAIRAGRAVELIFKEADANPPRTFEARQLIFDVFTQAWFAWGWDRRYNAERHHRLDQMAQINPVEGPGRSAQGPFPDGTPSNQIGGWRGGEPIAVKAVLQKQWIFAVKQAPAPFPDFKLTDIEEGKAEVTFTGTDLRAIARWCMQFGDGLQVQEPQRLVDRIKQVGVAWAGKAAQAPAPPPSKPTKAEVKPETKPEPKPEPRPERRHEPRPEPPRAENGNNGSSGNKKKGLVEVRYERL